MAYGYIYGLADVSEPQRIRYVGQTTRSVKERVDGHWHSTTQYKNGKRKPTAVVRWMEKRNRQSIVAITISEHENLDSLNAAEKQSIASYKSVGMADLNIAEGGGTGPLAAGTRELLREAHMGERSSAAKTTWETVRAVRDAYMNGVDMDLIREMIPEVSEPQLVRILRNRRWVDENYSPPKPRTTAKINFEVADQIRMRRIECFTPRRVLAQEYGISVVLLDKVLKNELWHSEWFDRSMLAPSNRDHVRKRGPSSR